MSQNKYIPRSFAGATQALQLLGELQAADLSFFADPSIGSFSGWPTGANGPFTVAVDQGLPTFEKIQCSSFNSTTGQFIVDTTNFTGGQTGRGADSTTPTDHVVQANISQIVLTWQAEEAQEANDAVVAVMGGAAAASAGQVLTASGGAPVWQTPGGSSAGLMPVGGILLWAAAASFPSGFLACNGQLISQTTYSGLYAILGTAYGSGSGTFGLPSFNDKFPIGVGATAASVGATGGSRTITSGQMPVHNHTASDSGHTHPGPAPQQFITGSFATSTIYTNSGANADHSPAYNISATSNTNSGQAVISVANAGSGNAYDQPYIGMLYLMRCL